MKSTVFAGMIEFSSQSDASYNSGLYRRTPQRESWEQLGNGLPDGVQVHAIVGRPGDPQALYIGTQFGLFYSADSGDSWTDLGVPVTDSAVYSILLHPHDPAVFLATLSASARGDAGSLYRSRDKGETWQRLDRDISIESTLMKVAVSPGDPDRIYCAARRGQVFGTEDGGANWKALPLLPNAINVRAIHCI